VVQLGIDVSCSQQRDLIEDLRRSRVQLGDADAGTAVWIDWNGPRISAGAFGLGSKESSCDSPPSGEIQSSVRYFFVASACTADRPGKASESRERLPRVIASLRSGRRTAAS